MKISQAPSLNFTMAKISTTMKDTTAATPFTAMPRFQWPTRASWWCLTMPAPAKVKPVNTPMA